MWRCDKLDRVAGTDIRELGAPPSLVFRPGFPAVYHQPAPERRASADIAHKPDAVLKRRGQVHDEIRPELQAPLDLHLVDGGLRRPHLVEHGRHFGAGGGNQLLVLTQQRLRRLGLRPHRGDLLLRDRNHLVTLANAPIAESRQGQRANRRGEAADDTPPLDRDAKQLRMRRAWHGRGSFPDRTDEPGARWRGLAGTGVAVAG
jgi:hypothetical protein